jgi:riboflavin biosynthesis pyrimidine reductase
MAGAHGTRRRLPPVGLTYSGRVARLRRLHPEPAELDADAFLAGIELPRNGGNRPRVALNMVASVDGRAAVDGQSRPLTGPFDRALFHALRGSTDAVLVGSRTLRTERYGPLVREAARRQARVDRGLSPMPLACIVSRSGDVDFSVPLFGDAEQTVVVFTGGRLEEPDCAAHVRVVSAPAAELELGPVMRRLRADHGVRSLLCEGGPTINAALLRARVVDELFLSVAPQLAGGADPLAIVAGDIGAPLDLTLEWMLEADAMVFLRYGVKTDG